MRRVRGGVELCVWQVMGEGERKREHVGQWEREQKV